MLRQLLVLLCIAICVTSLQLETYTYKNVGGLELKADVYTPESTTYDKYPVVLVIHCGGYIFGDRSSMAFSSFELNETLARGWVAVSIDYRLAPDVLLDQIVEDIQDAYKWIRTELIKQVSIDPDSITLYGASAGGGLALIGGFKLDPRPIAIVAFGPSYSDFTKPYVYDPNTPVNESFVELVNSFREPLTGYVLGEDFLSDPRYNLLFHISFSRKAGWMLTTHDPNESPDTILAKLKEFSAVYHVDGDYPPTYLVHGLADDTIPYEQSAEMAQQLEENNIDHQLHLLDGIGHNFGLFTATSPTQTWIEYILPAFDFIEHHMTS